MAAFDLLNQFQSPFEGPTSGPQFNEPAPQGNNLMQLMALLAPYFQEQARSSREFIPQLVLAKQAMAGGGRRDMSGNLMNPDPLAELERKNAIWNATFTPTSERISKERERFQTPADIPTFTEQELAGVNARARARTAGRGVPPQAPAENPATAPTTPMAAPSMGSPTPTPPVRRVAPAPPAPAPATPSSPAALAALSPFMFPGVGTTPSVLPDFKSSTIQNAGAALTPLAFPGMGTTPSLPWEQMLFPMIAPPQGYAPGAGFPRQQRPIR